MSCPDAKTYAEVFGDEETTWRPQAPVTFWFARHGQSEYNTEDRIGGDSSITPKGQQFADLLPALFGTILKASAVDPRFVTVWTSTLLRTIQTASKLPLPQVHLWELDEINGGVCDGMTYEDIKRFMPYVHYSRKKDKLHYRYPSGESYVDLCKRVWPVVQQLKRQGGSKLVVGHQAVLRCIFGYLEGRPLSDITNLSVPHHAVFEFTVAPDGSVTRRDYPMEAMLDDGDAPRTWPFDVSHSRPLTCYDLQAAGTQSAPRPPLLLQRTATLSALNSDGTVELRDDAPPDAEAAAGVRRQRGQPVPIRHDVGGARDRSTVQLLQSAPRRAAPSLDDKDDLACGWPAMPQVLEGATATISPASNATTLHLEASDDDAYSTTTVTASLARFPVPASAFNSPCATTACMSIPERLRRALPSGSTHNPAMRTNSSQLLPPGDLLADGALKANSCNTAFLRTDSDPFVKAAHDKLQQQRLDTACPACGSPIVMHLHGATAEASARGAASEDADTPLKETSSLKIVTSAPSPCDSFNLGDGYNPDGMHDCAAGSPSAPYHLATAKPRACPAHSARPSETRAVATSGFVTDDPLVNGEELRRKVEDENGFWFRREVWMNAVEHKEEVQKQERSSEEARFTTADMPW